MAQTVHTKEECLLNLIDDPDVEIFTAVRNEIIKSGTQLIPALEEASNTTSNELVKKRCAEMLVVLRKENVFQLFEDWAASEDKNLLRAAYIIDLLFNDSYPYSDIVSEIHHIVSELKHNVKPSLTPLRKIRAINQYIYQTLLFQKAKSNTSLIKAYSLKNTFDSRSGNMYVMAILYESVAHALGIELAGMLLPDNFTLAYIDPQSEDEIPEPLFYINPNNRGAIFTQLEIEDYLKRISPEGNLLNYSTCSNEKLIVQMLQSLHKIAQKGNSPQEHSLVKLLQIVRGEN